MAHADKALQTRLLTPNLIAYADMRAFWHRAKAIVGDAMHRRRTQNAPRIRVDPVVEVRLPRGKLALGAIVYKDSVEIIISTPGHPALGAQTWLSGWRALYGISFTGHFPRTVYVAFDRTKVKDETLAAVLAALHSEVETWAAAHSFEVLY